MTSRRSHADLSTVFMNDSETLEESSLGVKVNKRERENEYENASKSDRERYLYIECISFGKTKKPLLQ